MAGVPFRGTPDRQSVVAERWRTLRLAPHQQAVSKSAALIETLDKPTFSNMAVGSSPTCGSLGLLASADRRAALFIRMTGTSTGVVDFAKPN
jgi:hypothetical protein